MKLEDNKDHPFTAATSYSPTVQRLHFMFGNLSRVDVRLNTEDKKPYCNWFCRDQEFILRAGRLPLYGANYFPMLYAILKGWAHSWRSPLKTKWMSSCRKRPPCKSTVFEVASQILNAQILNLHAVWWIWQITSRLSTPSTSSVSIFEQWSTRCVLWLYTGPRPFSRLKCRLRPALLFTSSLRIATRPRGPA